MIATNLRKVYLHGSLGDKFGKEFSLAVNSAPEAVRLLNANFSGFVEEVRKGEFRVIRGNRDRVFYLDEDTFHVGLGSSELHIVPVPVGSKKSGLTKIIIGVALIGLSFAFAPAIVGALGPTLGMGTSIVGGVTYGNIAMMGVSMAIGGLAQMMTPKVKSYDTNNTPDQRSSFISNGPVNSTEQGVPVPLVYGRMRVGSVLVASSITTEQL